jgi:5-methylcytosine-specific restriction endonuclease McrA
MPRILCPHCKSFVAYGDQRAHQQLHRSERDRLRAAGVLPGYPRKKGAQAGFSKKVLARDGHRCVKCGRDYGLQAHHVIPLHRGGDYSVGNGVTLCTGCHRAIDRFAR